ncbi:beta-lactamase family protein [Bradyrhizobium sp. WSM 1738]|uniref:serine hydrolase domain-containing protein n=1 Tax=Bradyrhizobium hereditatis TaxID=2821405 RepID=UPI001CE279EC|nr:serine hydrolase domain-containing protein [Bradyrhizobium hereditatis]MCA6119017.1 beta-lactamase family protein [Bradyrhizobium hereditatis]
MISRRLVIGLLGAVTAFALYATPVALAFSPEARNAKLDETLRGLVEGRSTPGIVVLILQDGRPVYSRSVGVREVGSAAPIGENDMFRLASMTKAVTSVAAMILVEQGQIGLDDPVSRFLIEFANLRVREPDGTEVPASRPPTIRELLTHTAGFSYNFVNNPRLVDAYREARVTDGLDQPEVTTAEAMRRLASVPLGYQPGTSWEYSLATDVLGAVIEKVTGSSLEAFVTERIAKPLQIKSFVFNVPEAIRSSFVQVTRPAQVTGALGTGYVPVVEPEAVPFPPTKGTANLDPNRAFAPTAYNSGGAGMSGTIGDYARFLQMLLNEGELDGVRVLRAETVRQMTQNATGDMRTIRGPGWGFTLGFGIVTDPAAAKSRLPAGSYGWGGIYGTQFWIDPANRVVGLVLTQTAIIGSGPIANLVREAFYRAD